MANRSNGWRSRAKGRGGKQRKRKIPLRGRLGSAPKDAASQHSLVAVPTGPMLGASALEWIPLSIFIPMSIITLGLYPHIWMLRRIDALASVGSRSIDRGAAAAYCVIGALVQLMLAAAAAAFIVSIFLPASGSGSIASIALRAYAAAYITVLFPIRSYVLFEIRRQIRRAAFVWDPTGIMVPRTVPSMVMLTLFGSAYLQHHINRLMSLGMIEGGAE